MGWKFEIPEAVLRKLAEQETKKERNLKKTGESGVIQFLMP